MFPIRATTFAIATLLLILLPAACDTDSSPTTPAPGDVTFEADFTIRDDDGDFDAAGWEADFAHYSVVQEEIMEFASGHEPLPEQVEGGPANGDHGLFIGATNRSDDVFMYWTGRMEGLEPGTTYRVEFTVQFATDSPAGCVGIGGPPGESVWVKAGATSVKPEPVLDESRQNPYWLMNIDKGNQTQGGEDAIVLGNVANTLSECVGERVWELKTLASSDPFLVTPADDGSVWLIVGTDSGFEGRTELYYTRLEATFEPL